jgi:HK97 family phage major capsid protein
MSYALQLRQERFALIHHEMADALANPNRAVGLARFRELDDKQRTLEAQITAAERKDALDREMATVADVHRPPINSGRDEPTRSTGPHHELRSTPEYARDFDHWLRSGRTGSLLPDAPEQRAALGDTTGGAVLVPTGFEYALDIKLKSYAGLRQAARILKTPTGNNIPFPVADDTGNVGEWLPEFQAGTESEPNFSNVILTSNLLSSKYVKYSVQLEQDSAFDLVALLTELLSTRVARTSETAYLTGSGSGQPMGLQTALVAASAATVMAAGGLVNSGNAADTDITTIGTDDLDNLLQALDPAYQQNAAYMGHSSTWATLRRLKDKYGRSIWDTSLAVGAPDTVWGKKYYVNQQMSPIGPNNISVICGDFSHFIIRDALGLTLVRYNELFMQSYERGYQCFIRTDSQLLQPAAFAMLKHNAS